MAKERIHWIDIAKGILILLLLIHHFGPAIRGTEIPRDDFSFVFNWQFIFVSFFMQAFLFMSGFCSNFSKDVKNFFIGLLKQLFIPFCFFELLTCIYWSYEGAFSISRVYNNWINSNGTHYWFLNALILSKIIIYLFAKIINANRNAYLLIVSFLLLLLSIVLNDYNIGSNFLCIRQSLGSVFFVALGYIAKANVELLDKSLKLGGGFPCALIFLAVLGFRPPCFTATMGVTLKTFVVFLVTSTTGILAFISLCKIIAKSKVFEFFGRNSLVVYCVHFIPLKLLVNNLYGLMMPNSVIEIIFFLLLVYSLEVIVCSSLIYVFNKKPLKYIIGKY